MNVTARAMLGFAVAPLPIFLLLSALAAPSPEPGEIGFAALLSYGPALLFGVPIHLLLRRFRKRRLSHYLLWSLACPGLVLGASFVLGIVGSFGYGALMYLPGFFLAVILTPFVALTATLFWLVAVRGSGTPDEESGDALVTTFE